MLRALARLLREQRESLKRMASSPYEIIRGLPIPNNTVGCPFLLSSTNRDPKLQKAISVNDEMLEIMRSVFMGAN